MERKIRAASDFSKIKTLQILGIHEPMGKENVIRDALDDVFKDDLVTEDPLLRLTEKGKLLLKKSLTTSFAGILKGNGGSGKKIFPDLHDLYYYRNHGFRFHWIYLLFRWLHTYLPSICLFGQGYSSS